jgi:hypothetical protein
MPFDKDGNMSHEGRWSVNEWKITRPWHARMRIVDASSGWGGTYLTLEDEAGLTYPIFYTDLAKYLGGGGNVTQGWIDEMWTGSKKGTKYGIKPLV